MSRHRLIQPEIFKSSQFRIRTPKQDKQAFKNYKRIHLPVFLHNNNEFQTCGYKQENYRYRQENHSYEHENHGYERENYDYEQGYRWENYGNKQENYSYEHENYNYEQENHYLYEQDNYESEQIIIYTNLNKNLNLIQILILWLIMIQKYLIEKRTFLWIKITQNLALLILLQ